MAWYPFSALADIQRTVHTILKQSAEIQRTVHMILKRVNHLSEQSAEIQQDVDQLQATATAISDGVTAALAHITDLENQVANGQPVDPAVLASLKQAVSDIGTAAQGVGGLATA